jgi:hypothetical protein
MASESEKTAVASFGSLISGMLGHIRPNLLEGVRAAVSKAVNVSFRSGFAETRPGFEKIGQFFDQSKISSLDGAGVWSLDNHEFVFVLNKRSLLWLDVKSKTTGIFPFVFARDGFARFTQVDKYLVVQNGIDKPVVLELASNGAPYLKKSEKIKDPDGGIVRGARAAVCIATMRGTAVIQEFSSVVITSNLAGTFKFDAGDNATEFSIEGNIVPVVVTKSYMQSGRVVGRLTATITGTVKIDCDITDDFRDVEKPEGEPNYQGLFDASGFANISVAFVAQGAVPEVHSVASILVELGGSGTFSGISEPDTPLMIDSISIPAGTAGIWTHGRYHVVPVKVPGTEEPGQTCIVSGDVMLLDEKETGLRFTETQYLSEGGANGTPEELGSITTLAAQRNSINGTGVGTTYAICRDGVCAFDFSVPRAYWKQTGISSVLFRGGGSIAPNGSVSVNNQVAYRSIDGIRVVAYTLSEEAGGTGALSSSVVSRAVDLWFDKETEDGQRRAFSTHADNRLFTTVNLGKDKIGAVCWDVAADNFQGFMEASTAWNGLWTQNMSAAVSIMHEGRRKACFIMNDGAVCVLSDTAQDYGKNPVWSRIETAAFSFGDPVANKKLDYVDLDVSDVSETTEFRVWTRPSGHPFWLLVQERTLAVSDQSAPIRCSKLRFAVQGLDKHGCNPVSKKPLDSGESLQFAVEWRGRARLDSFTAFATRAIAEAPGTCDSDEEYELLPDGESGVKIDDFCYTAIES